MTRLSRHPRIQELARIAEVFGCDPITLISGRPPTGTMRQHLVRLACLTVIADDRKKEADEIRAQSRR